MKAIYEPSGRAKEYGDLACNLYSGCAHRCDYCYVPAVLHVKPEEFRQRVSLRAGVLDALRKEAPKYAGRAVFLCFTCDPYPGGDVSMATREAITILNAAGVAVRILTKGGMRGARDFDLLKLLPRAVGQTGSVNSFGVTLTCAYTPDSLLREPGAAIPSDRIGSLAGAYAAGIHTWASLEPVLDPEWSLNLIERAAPYVDEFRVGKLNHTDSTTDWVKFRNDATGLLRRLHRTYRIKKDLAEAKP